MLLSNTALDRLATLALRVARDSNRHQQSQAIEHRLDKEGASKLLNTRYANG
jgi:hypothetical protein